MGTAARCRLRQGTARGLNAVLAVALAAGTLAACGTGGGRAAPALDGRFVAAGVPGAGTAPLSAGSSPAARSTTTPRSRPSRDGFRIVPRGLASLVESAVAAFFLRL